MNYRIGASLFAILIAVAGCTGVRVSDTEGRHNFYDGAFEYATQSGSIKTSVVGSPFSDINESQIATRVTDTMRNAPFGRDVAFIPSPRNTEKNAFHTVVVFNGVQPFTEDEMCENDVPIQSRPGNKTTSMHAAFCQGAHPISYAFGFVDDLSGPSDPNFNELVRLVAQAMVPRFDDYYSSGFTPF